MKEVRKKKRKKRLNEKKRKVFQKKFIECVKTFTFTNVFLGMALHRILSNLFLLSFGFIELFTEGNPFLFVEVLRKKKKKVVVLGLFFYL